MTAQLTLQPIAPVPVNVSFGVSGSFLLVPNFIYQNDSGPKRSFPVGSPSPTSLTGSFAFTHPPFTASGTHNIHVTELTTGATASVSVTITTGPAPPPPALGRAWSTGFSSAYG